MRLLGVAFVTGWAATGIVWVLLLVAGARLGVTQVVLVCLVLAVGGAVVARYTPAVPDLPPIRPIAVWPVAALAAAVVVLYLEELGRRAATAGASYHTDAWG